MEHKLYVLVIVLKEHEHLERQFEYKLTRIMKNYVSTSGVKQLKFTMATMWLNINM